MKFTITNIVSERSMDGKSTYYAISDDKIAVEVTMPNMIKATPEILRKKFNEAYKVSYVKHDEIKIGDVI